MPVLNQPDPVTFINHGHREGKRRVDEMRTFYSVKKTGCVFSGHRFCRGEQQESELHQGNNKRVKKTKQTQLGQILKRTTNPADRNNSSWRTVPATPRSHQL